MLLLVMCAGKGVLKYIEGKLPNVISHISIP